MEIVYIFLGLLPSAIVSFGVFLIQRSIKKRDKKREEEEKARREKEEQREKLREQNELFIVQGVSAAIALGEATAKAVQRIKDAKCNGDMHAALDYVSKVKHEHRDFLVKQGISHINE